MRRLLRVLAFCALLVACAPADAPLPPTPTPFPTVAARLSPPPAVPEPGQLLVVLDGVYPADFRAALDAEALPTLATLTGRGTFTPLTPPEPTVVEGALAALRAGEPIGPGLRWNEAARCDRALVGDWPSAGPESAARGVTLGPPLAAAAAYQPALAPAPPWQGAPPSFSPRLEGQVTLPHGTGAAGVLLLLAVDGSNDGVAAYDEFWLDEDRRIGPESARLTLGDGRWATTALADGTVASWLLLGMEGTGPRLVSSAPHPLHIWPETLRAPLLAELGGLPAPPALGLAGLADDGALAALGHAQSAWLGAAAGWLWAHSAGSPCVALRVAAPGLLAQHWLLVEPAQAGWSPDEQRRLATLRQDALAEADRTLAALLGAVDLSRNEVAIVSPLGLAPFWQEIAPAALLVAQGLPAPAALRVEGASGWLLTAVAQRDAAQRALQAATDPATQRPLFAQVEPLPSGELWLRASPGFALSTRRDGPPLQPSAQRGGPGAAPDSPEMAGWLLRLVPDVGR